MLIKSWFFSIALLVVLQAQAQNLKPAFKALEKRDFAEALGLFQAAHSANAQDVLANYGLSLLYAHPTYPEKNTPLALQYIVAARKHHQMLDAAALATVNKQATDVQMQQQQVQIEEILLADLAKSQDEDALRELITTYPTLEKMSDFNTLWEQAGYAKLLQQPSIARLEAYLEQFPQKAQDPAIVALKPQLVFEQIRQKPTVLSCEAFLADFAQAPQATEVKQILYREAFQSIAQSPSVEAYQAFLAKFPEAPQAENARQKIQELNDQSAYDKDYLLGKVDPYKHPLLVMIDLKYSHYGNPQYMHKEAYAAFVAMHEAALTDGVKLSILSSGRTFYDQTMIWESKWRNLGALPPVDKAKNILAYSSMPGTSRHHWGTDLDLNSLSPAYFSQGEGKKIYDWLCSNAPKFGFFQPYKELGFKRYTGYLEEKWHWSYAPISEKCLKLYNQIIQYQDIAGYVGSEIAEIIDVINTHVRSIDHD